MATLTSAEIAEIEAQFMSLERAHLLSMQDSEYQQSLFQDEEKDRQREQDRKRKKEVQDGPDSMSYETVIENLKAANSVMARSSAWNGTTATRKGIKGETKRARHAKAPSSSPSYVLDEEAEEAKEKCTPHTEAQQLHDAVHASSSMESMDTEEDVLSMRDFVRTRRLMYFTTCESSV